MTDIRERVIKISVPKKLVSQIEEEVGADIFHEERRQDRLALLFESIESKKQSSKASRVPSDATMPGLRGEVFVAEDGGQQKKKKKRKPFSTFNSADDDMAILNAGG
ncbi:hypothetical protein KBC75_04645 [Candidatus Shapirobacteria bacterium]|nr:hypothetical protein [Candidatus Shapirobacteria bacterium]